MKVILVVGATSSIAQACIKQWCILDEKTHFIFIARDKNKLEDFNHNLLIRYQNIDLKNVLLDLYNLDQIGSVVDLEFKANKIDIALIASGVMYQNEEKLTDLDIEQLISLNCTSTTIVIRHIYECMTAQQSGKIAVISSVAGDRGRKANYLYGASKSYLSTYVEGLQHKIALLEQNISVSLIKPGPTASKMTQHLVEQGKKLANIDNVAKVIVSGIDKNKRVIYAPPLWQIIMLVIRLIPFVVFKKLDI